MAKETQFKLELLVGARLIGPIVELMKDEGTVLSVTNIDVAVPKENHQRHSSHRRHKGDGLTADALLINSLRDRSKLTNSQIKEIFVKNNFSDKTVGGTVSRLKRQRKITYDANHEYLMLV